MIAPFRDSSWSRCTTWRRRRGRGSSGCSTCWRRWASAHRSLLVIPNFRGEGCLDVPGRVLRLAAPSPAARGTRSCCTGTSTSASGSREMRGERFRNRWFTQGEGEFLSLEYGAALDRIARGQAMLHRAGLDPQGFVAPAWLINEEGLRAARDLGFQYTNLVSHRRRSRARAFPLGAESRLRPRPSQRGPRRRRCSGGSRRCWRAAASSGSCCIRRVWITRRVWRACSR